MIAIHFIRNDLKHFTLVLLQFRLFLLALFSVNFSDIGVEFFFREIVMVLS